MSPFAGLKADIRREIENLTRRVHSMHELRAQLRSPEPTEFDVRAAGSLLHDFYTGLAKMFQRIALKVDQDLPAGSDWHLQLLQRMATRIDGVRPPILSDDEMRHLEEYLRFRHLFRNLYGFELRWELIEPLVEDMGVRFEEIRSQLEDFMASFDGSS